MRIATKRRLRLFLRLSLAGTLIRVAYGSFMGRAFRGTALIGSLVGAIDSATIAAVIAAIEVFLLRTRWGRPKSCGREPGVRIDRDATSRPGRGRS